MRKYSIIIKYLEDVEPKYHDTGNFSDQPDLDDRLLETAVKVVSDSYKSGDILIFMPGMREIKRMSDSLERFR
jgi:HrpA-like RNA helicase